jgi:hypothetical protein
MRRLIDVPAWTDEEEFDGKTLGLFIERGLASGDGIVGRPVHDVATGCAVWQDLNDAARVTHILPVADVGRSDNRLVTFVGPHRGRDLLGGDYHKNDGNDRRDRKSDGASQTGGSSSAS